MTYLIHTWLKFVVPSDNMSDLVQIMAWQATCEKSLLNNDEPLQIKEWLLITFHPRQLSLEMIFAMLFFGSFYFVSTRQVTITYLNWRKISIIALWWINFFQKEMFRLPCWSVRTPLLVSPGLWLHQVTTADKHVICYTSHRPNKPSKWWSPEQNNWRVDTC